MAQSDASSSSSSAAISYGPYDVFINHRGPDVKNTFAGHLYHELKSKGLQVFLDRPELQAGHYISDQIKSAIEVASVHIAIFSEHYAESTWCLKELVLMLKSRGTILPVFYNVKPSDLRWSNKRKYAEDLQNHEEQQRYDWQTIQGWKNALSRVADISGFELDACNGDEVELVDKVVQRVLKEVPKSQLFVANHKIGLKEKLEDFKRRVLSQLDGQGQDLLEAKVVGIVGLGGIGKSTLAREFFNRKRSNYNFSSFLFDVRENARTKSLAHLQKELIHDIRRIDVQIKSWVEGISILENNLKSCRALIIIDDVDHLDQLHALLPIKHVLDPMSLILITSRDKHVLRTAGIADSSIYELKGLDRPNSLKLFCSHAFFQPHPPPEFVDLVDGFLKVCDGLPLSLQVFGSLLCQEDDRSCWEDQLNGLQTLPHDIQGRLKISYDSLSPEEQKIFLDIACFSIGRDKDEWVRIWGWSGWKGSMGLRNLQNKCLIEVDEENRIRMHDQVRDMGRSILAQDPSLPRRLGGATPKDVYDLLEQSSSSVIEVRGIIMAPWWSTERDRWNWEEESFSDKVFGISKLQLLDAEGDFVEGILKLVRSPNLIWLRWYECPCSSLPSCIPMRHLRFLEVEGRHLQTLWQRESQRPVQLRQLYIHAPILQFPNSQNLASLQNISLRGCQSLKVFPDSIENLKNLESIDMGFCKSLKALPNAFGTLTNLREIDLEACTSLENLPNSIENLSNLQNIKLKNCKRLKVLPVLPIAIGTVMNLREIDLSGCVNLKTLPYFSESLTNLQNISLRGCKSLDVLPDSMENLKNLQSIDMGFCKSLKALPNAFGTLTNLREIDMEDCISLADLPNSIENLSNLQNINLKNCERLEVLPVLPNAIGAVMNLREIDLSGCANLKRLPNFSQNLSNLQTIGLEGCESLEVLPDSIENLRNLQSINLRFCSSLKALPNAFGTLTNLREIDLKGCKSMEDLPNSIENLTNLQNINLEDCKRLKALPNGIWTLMNHRRIDLSGFVNLKRLPNFSENLSNVQNISLRRCKSLEVLPDSIENLRNLQQINLACCESLKALPNAFGTLTNLREIDLEGCKSLEDVPNTIENLTNLQNIKLEGCTSLEVLPNVIGTLMNLREIDLSGCVRLKRLPNFSENLSNVQNISLSGCISLEVLPDSIENLTDLQQINLAYCESLKALPYNFGNLTNLKYIDASYASNLQMPPNFLGNLLQLTHLHLSCCSRLILSNETLGNTTTLECLDLSGCLQIEVLPLQVLQLRFLKRLNLLRTNIRELPSAPTVCLNNLEVLILGSPLLKVLPPWLGCLENLKKLLLHGCPELKCLPDSIGQCSQMREMEISKCGIQYLPPAIMQLNNLETLRVLDCPLRELPFKKVEGEGEPSVKLMESSQGRELDSSSDGGMNRLRTMHLYLTEISEVSFPAGVCPNLGRLKIRWCNDLVEVGALPTRLCDLDLRGCGALRKVGGLCGLEELERLDIRGCCSLEVEELAGVETVLSMDTLRPILTSLEILKTPFETSDSKEAQMTEAEKDVRWTAEGAQRTEAEKEVRWTADLDHGVLRTNLLCRQNMEISDEDEDEDEGW